MKITDYKITEITTVLPPQCEEFFKYDKEEVANCYEIVFSLTASDTDESEALPTIVELIGKRGIRDFLVNLFGIDVALLDLKYKNNTLSCKLTLNISYLEITNILVDRYEQECGILSTEEIKQAKEARRQYVDAFKKAVPLITEDLKRHINGWFSPIPSQMEKPCHLDKKVSIYAAPKRLSQKERDYIYEIFETQIGKQALRPYCYGKYGVITRAGFHGEETDGVQHLCAQFVVIGDEVKMSDKLSVVVQRIIADCQRQFALFDETQYKLNQTIDQYQKTSDENLVHMFNEMINQLKT